MSIDVIGDFLTVIRNGIMRSKPFVIVPYSREKHRIASLLKDEGFVRDVLVEKADVGNTIKVMLKYVNGESVIHEIDRVSTPGSRVYRGSANLGTVAGGFGVVIVSTNKGIITNKQARELAVGGEVLCTVW
jgi:small subunit ribosomal protein S8